MTFSQLPKPNFTAILISSLIALQITTAEAAITTDTDTNQDAMYSYNANLSDAQPLSGAALEQTTVYMFFNNTPQYSSMNFYCCKGIDGASTGEAHKTVVSDSSAPFVYSVDLSQYSTTGTRELYVDRIRTDGSGFDNIYVNFSINISIIPIIPTPEPSPNTPAVISGIDRASVTEDVDPDADNLLEVSGILNITDSDAGEAAFIAKVVNGNYGNLLLATTGQWFYGADNNQAVIQNLASGATLTDSLIVNSVDGTPHTIVITIKGMDETNNPALITGIDRANVTEDVDPDADNLLEVSGLLNITDSNTGEAAFIAKVVNGNYGKLLIAAAGQWYYVADNNQTVIQNLASGATLNDRLIVNSVDGTPHTIVITIKGMDEANSPALITGIDRASVTEDIDPDADNLLEVSGLLNITDSDTGEAAFIAKVVNGDYGIFYIATAGQWYYAADNSQTVIQNLVSGATLTDSMIVNSVDGTAHTVAITILGVDENNTPADIILSWVAPAEREDNSALSLSAIAGYKVYYGTTQGQYSDNIAINDGTAAGYTFTGLPAGTYYFVVTTIDTEGRESQYSSVVTIII